MTNIGILIFLLLALRGRATFWGIPTPGPDQMHCFFRVSFDLAVLFGGQDSQIVAHNEIHFYNLTTNRWTTVVPLGTVVPPPRVMPICAAINAHTILVYGGYSAFVYEAAIVPFTDMYTFDLRSLTWTALPPSPVEQGGAAGVCANGICMAFGGQPYEYGMSAYAQDSCTDITMLYNLTSQQWRQWNGTNGPSERCYATVTLIGSQAFMMGGSPAAPLADSGVLMDVWGFDMVHLNWTNYGHNGTAPADRSWGLSASNGPKLYYMGGTGGSWFSDIYVFDINTRTWSRVPANMPLGTIALSGFFANGNIYYYGGWTPLGDVSSLEAETLATLTFQDLSFVDDTLSAQAQRFDYAATLYQDLWYVFGGARGSTSAVRNDMVMLDLKTFAWTFVVQNGTIPQPRYSHVWVTIGDKGVMFGGAGANFDPVYNDTWIFDFPTHTWSRLATNPDSIPLDVGATAVVWQQWKMVVFGGENCCLNLAGVYILDFTANMSAPTWSVLQTTGPSPIGRWYHVSTLVGDTMYVFGGQPGLNDLWVLNLLMAVWTQLFPNGAIPSARWSAASVLLGRHWYINGGQNQLGQTLSETWAYDVVDQTWTQIRTLDANTPSPMTVMEHQGVASPFGDQLIIWGPGASPGGTEFRTQFLSPGYHDITISGTTGSDVLCQLDEKQPCQSFAFALTRFAGASFREFTVSGDLTNTFSISQSQIVQSFQLSVPVRIQGTAPGVVLDCRQTTCFSVSNVLSNPFTLVNLVLRNGFGTSGGAISASNSRISLTSVTIENSHATQQGGALFLASSTLQATNVTLTNNTAGKEGGAVFAWQGSQLMFQGAIITRNVAGQIGGAFSVTASTFEISDADVSHNQVRTVASTASSTPALIGGGAIGATDCAVTLVSCRMDSNGVTAPAADTTYGGGVLLYTSTLVAKEMVCSDNSAGNGGAVASLSIRADAATLLANVLQTSQLVFSQAQFTNNVAFASGGALYTSDARLVEAIDCVLFNNSAQVMGGAWIASTSSLVVDGSTLTHNTCWNGNGGALALLSSSCNITASTLGWNASPNGGGGAVYWGPGTDATAASSDAISILPRIDRTTLSAAVHNAASFGSSLASSPFSIQLSSNWTVHQSAGNPVFPYPTLFLTDYHNQTVSNLPIAIQAVSDPSGAIATAGNVVNTQDGVAVFSGLQVLAQPGSRFALHFVSSNGFSTRPIYMVVASCYPPSFYLDNSTHPSCKPCLPRYVTRNVNDVQCMAQSRPGDILVWSVNPYLMAVAVALCFGLMAMAPNHIRYMVNRVLHGSGWKLPLLFVGWIRTLAEMALVTLFVQSVTVSTRFIGTSDPLPSNQPWALWFFQWLLLLALRWSQLLIARESILARQRTLHDIRKERVTVIGSQKTSQAQETASAGMIHSAAGSSQDSAGNIRLQEKEDVIQNATANEQQRRRDYNRKHLRHIEVTDVAWFSTYGVLDLFGTLLNLFLQLYGVSQASQWTIGLIDNWHVTSFGYLTLLLPLACIVAFPWIRYDPETHAWRRYICAGFYCLMWFGTTWIAFLGQPIVYQGTIDAASNGVLASDGSSPTTVFISVFVLAAVTLGIHALFQLRDNDASHAATINSLWRRIDERDRAIRNLHMAGQTSCRTLHELMSVATYNRVFLYRYYQHVFRPRFQEHVDMDSEQIQKLVDECNSWGATSDLFRMPPEPGLAQLLDQPIALAQIEQKTMMDSKTIEIETEPFEWEEKVVLEMAKDPVATEVFAEYARNNHDQENILALADALLFEAESNHPRYALKGSSLEAFARHLYELYVDPGKAPMQVNISGTQVEKIKSKLSKPDPTMFETMVTELQHLVFSNSQNSSNSFDKLPLFAPHFNVISQIVKQRRVAEQHGLPKRAGKPQKSTVKDSMISLPGSSSD